MRGPVDNFDIEVRQYMEKYKADKEEALHEVFYKDGFSGSELRNLRGGEDGVGENDNVIAFMVAETNEGGYFEDCGEIVYDDSGWHYKRISEIRNKIAPDEKIRIFYGVQYC